MKENEVKENEKVSEIQTEINRLEAIKAGITAGITDKNTITLIREILDLKAGIGLFPNEWNEVQQIKKSKIKGVQDIFEDSDIESEFDISVRITSPAGKLLPKTVFIEDEDGNQIECKIDVYRAIDYNANLDY